MHVVSTNFQLVVRIMPLRILCWMVMELQLRPLDGNLELSWAERGARAIWGSWSKPCPTPFWGLTFLLFKAVPSGLCSRYSIVFHTPQLNGGALEDFGLMAPRFLLASLLIMRWFGTPAGPGRGAGQAGDSRSTDSKTSLEINTLPRKMGLVGHLLPVLLRYFVRVRNHEEIDGTNILSVLSSRSPGPSSLPKKNTSTLTKCNSNSSQGNGCYEIKYRLFVTKGATSKKSRTSLPSLPLYISFTRWHQCWGKSKETIRNRFETSSPSCETFLFQQSFRAWLHKSPPSWSCAFQDDLQRTSLAAYSEDL